MQLNLDDNELSALLNVLNSYIPELRDEIIHTDSYDMREELKAQEQTLRALVTKLSGSTTGGISSDAGATNPPLS